MPNLPVKYPSPTGRLVKYPSRQIRWFTPPAPSELRPKPSRPRLRGLQRSTKRTWRCVVRLKPDGSLDGLDHWRDPPPAKTGGPKHEELRRLLVEDLLRGRRPPTPEEAKKLIDGF